jgi:2-methylisocitrate lyase-like PEP mutase family enzyme
MERIGRTFDGTPLLANIVEEGDTPVLAHARIEALGYKIAAHPLTLLESAARGMERALAALRRGAPPDAGERLSFGELRELVGFDAYDAVAERFRED